MNMPRNPKTLRDEFAMAALPGLTSRGDYPSAHHLARAAYSIADALMEERTSSEIRKVQERREQQKQQQHHQ